jgi:glycosyltransferase involved in cell wall biosynthesis
MPGVDVVVPCYNYGRFLEGCVGSILAQEGVAVRVLIIDNASADESPAVALALADRDSRIGVVSHKTNKGATYSYNEGIDWAATEHFLVLDADDQLMPGALARAVAVLQAHPEVSFTHGIEISMKADGHLDSFGPNRGGPDVLFSTGPEFIGRLCRTPVNNIGANTVIRRTSAQKQAGYYRASLPYTDDLEMWLRLATLGDVASIRVPQAVRRYHESRMSNQYQGVQVRDFREREAAFESFFANEGRAVAGSERLLAEARRGLGEHAYWSALSHFSRGHRGLAAELLRLSHHWRPHGSLLPPLQWLMRMDRPVERALEIMSEAVTRRRRSDSGEGDAQSEMSPSWEAGSNGKNH